MIRSPEPHGEAPSSQRLVTFSDGVIAIAITLLAFQLRVPAIKDANSSSELARALGANWPGYRLYLITFVIIGYYWMIHHRVFRVIVGHDVILAWTNLLFLLGISALPFTANLFTHYPSNTTAMMIYAGTFGLISVSFLMISVVSERRGVLVEGADIPEVRLGQRRSMVTVAIFLLSIVLAPWVGPGAAESIWLAIPVAFVVMRARGKARAST